MEILITFGGAVIIALVSAVSYLFFWAIKLQDADTRCQRRLASISAQLVAVQAMQEQGATEAVVVVDAATGMIVEWSPAATMLLHWPQREILGKRLTTIMPQRYRERHNAVMADVVRSGRTPSGSPIQGHALTKDGQEVPVEVRLSGWHLGSQTLIGARIRLRDEGQSNSGEMNSIASGENT